MGQGGSNDAFCRGACHSGGYSSTRPRDVLSTTSPRDSALDARSGSVQDARDSASDVCAGGGTPSTSGGAFFNDDFPSSERSLCSWHGDDDDVSVEASPPFAYLVRFWPEDGHLLGSLAGAPPDAAAAAAAAGGAGGRAAARPQRSSYMLRQAHMQPARGEFLSRIDEGLSTRATDPTLAGAKAPRSS